MEHRAQLLCLEADLERAPEVQLPLVHPAQRRDHPEVDRDGFLVVEGVLTPAELAELEAEYAAILDRVLPALQARGLLVDLGCSTSWSR